LGKKQSGRDGLSYLKAAKLPEDRQLLEQARAAAAEVLQEYGLEPSGWPKDLLAALKDRSLPDLDLSEMSQLTWGSSKDMEATAEAGNWSLAHCNSEGFLLSIIVHSMTAT